jgi:2-polyprenyl-3-methyl-5-hydroxy-6-metoxy-1,4-benzoquinol methylase
MKNSLKIFNLLIKNKFIKKPFLFLLLRLDNLLYKCISLIAIQYNNGVHPKHTIINYKHFFSNNIKKDNIVLDIGSNKGGLSYYLSKKAKFVYAIEIDKNHHNFAIDNYKNENLEFINADATLFDYKNLKINCIVLSNVLEHILLRVEFLKKIQKDININNEVNILFLIRVPSLERDWLSVFKKNLGLEYRLDNTHYIEYTEAQLINELKNANLSIIELKHIYGEFYVKCVNLI